MSDLKMAIKIDETDRRIMRALAADSARSQREIAEELSLSQNALWRRIRRLEAEKLIEGYSARISRKARGASFVVFCMLRTRHHSADWMRRLKAHLDTIPEVAGFYRIGGDFDYLLKIETEDIAGYDRVYQRITEKMEFENVTSYFAMETIFENRVGFGPRS
jgi:Lrp/AsnC family transcriptional regulator